MNEISLHRRPFAIGEMTFILACSVFFASLGNVAFWRRTFLLIPANTGINIVTYLSLFIFLTSLIGALLSLFVWRSTAKPVIMALLLASAAANHFCVTYGVYIDRHMMLNTARTNMHEVMSLLTPQFFVWLAAFGIVPAVIVFFTPLKAAPRLSRRLGIRLLWMTAGVAAVAIAVLPLYREYASFFRNNREIVKLITPLNYMQGAYSLVRQSIHQALPLQHIGLDAHPLAPAVPHKPTLFVLVVGETARAQNFSLYGYERDTNPKLSRQPGVIIFRDTTSCGTATAISVPCMFSNMTRSSYSGTTAEHRENLLDILQRAGVAVSWQDNNTGCQGVCERIPSDIISGKLPWADCQSGFCHDLRLLPELDTRIAQQSGGDVFAVLHTIGSHGPSYHQRYPADYPGRFEPACNTNQIQNCSQEELVNVYDNTILYTDDVLNQLIELLKKHQSGYDVAMLYVSDHGESLGEKGIYLHAAPYMIAPAQQTQVPMIFWSSQDFLASRNIDGACLRQHAGRDPYSHDNLFHSMLGAMRVGTSEYLPALDLFTPCRIQ